MFFVTWKPIWLEIFTDYGGNRQLLTCKKGYPLSSTDCFVRKVDAIWE